MLMTNIIINENDQPSRNNSREIGVFKSSNTNAIGVFGSTVSEVRFQYSFFFNSLSSKPFFVFSQVHKQLLDHRAPIELFDSVHSQILNDLQFDLFPRFLLSPFYRRYIQTKYFEQQRIGCDSFYMLRVLGRGAFGSVCACKKKDTSKVMLCCLVSLFINVFDCFLLQVYAVKCISKKQIKEQDNTHHILNERNLLVMAQSRFVGGLQYAYQDTVTCQIFDRFFDRFFATLFLLLLLVFLRLFLIDLSSGTEHIVSGVGTDDGRRSQVSHQ
jgi:hypothetical protein